MPASLATACLVLGTVPSVSIAQLAAAELSVELGDTAAVVEARYEIRQPVASLRLLLAPLDDQDVDFQPAGRFRVERSGALRWVTVYGADGGPPAATVRYTVRGNLSRIPLPVPTLAAPAGAQGVTLRVLGLPTDVRLDRAFPRLASDADGWAVARLDHVPSVFRPPPPAGRWTLPRLTELVVVLLVAAASAAWVVRRRARRPA